MNKLTALLSAAALLVPLVVSAANFEGTVSMNMTDPRGNVMPITISAKAPLTRMDFETPQGAAGMIMDQAKQQVTILMPQQRMYMIQPIPAGTAEKAAKEDSRIAKSSQRNSRVSLNSATHGKWRTWRFPIVDMERIDS